MKRNVYQVTFAMFIASILLIPSLVCASVDTTYPIQFNTPPADAYADEMIDALSGFFRFGENALGAPDAEYAELFKEYGNGYLTYDMGLYERIWNDTGDDFTVISHSGAYNVKVGNNIQQPLITIGDASDNASFDLNDVGLEYAQYVQIQYLAGGEVYLDAIEAIHLEAITPETDPPVITPIEDFSVWNNQSTVEFTWEITESYPWSYVIKINDEIYQEGEWLENNIHFSYTITEPEILDISLTATDFFGFSSEDTVVVEILNTKGATALPMIFTIITLVGISIIFQRKQY